MKSLVYKSVLACTLFVSNSHTSLAELPNWSFSNTVEISPNTNIGTVSADLLSINHVYDKATDWQWDNKFAGKLNELQVRFIRYCGGEVTDRFHYLEQDGDAFVDSWHKTPASVGTWKWMDSDEYMSIFTSNQITSAKPLIGLNIESDRKHIVNVALAGTPGLDPLTLTGPHRDIYTVTSSTVDYAVGGNGIPDYEEEALAWVSDNEANYASENPDYYFIGNESYLPGTWEQMSVERYAEYINELAPKIRSINSNAKIVINWKGEWHAQWLDLFKPIAQGGAAGNFDYIDLHIYWNHNGWGTSTWENWTSRIPIYRGSRSYQNTFNTLRSNLDANGLQSVKIGAFEWNSGVVLDANGDDDLENMPSKYQIGMINTQAFMSFIEMNVDAACFWPMTWQNDTTGGIRSLLEYETGNKSVSYYVLKYFKDAMGKKQLSTVSNYDQTLVISMRSWDNNTIYTYLLSKRPGFVGTKIKLGSFNPTGINAKAIVPPGTVMPTSTVTGIAGNTDLDYRTEITPETEEVAAGEVNVVLAPYSLTRIVFTQ